MTGSELAWLAGIIEGEGCIDIHRDRHYAYPRVRVSMTDEDVVRRVAMIASPFGGGASRAPARNPAHKPVWTWAITGGPARELLAIIKPMMGSRRAAKIQEVVAC